MVARPTASRILIAARQLLEEGGVDGVSMRRVADAVGITAMAIYRHYPNQPALLDAVAEEGFQELSAALKRRRFSGDPERSFRKVADLFLDCALQSPKLFELMFLTRRRSARRFPEDFKAGRSPTASVAVKVLQDGMDRGVLRQDDCWEIVLETGAMLQGLVMLYLGGRIDATPAQFRALCQRALQRYLHGIHA